MSNDEVYGVLLEAKVDAYNAAMRSSGDAALAAAKGADKAKLASNQAAEAAKAKAAVYQKVGQSLLVTGTVLAVGLFAAAKAAAGFEKQMSGVRAVSGATESQMRQLSAAALKAGADTVFSASQAAKAEAELLKAGVSVKDVLGGALTGTLALAAAGQLELADAATIAAQAMNVFKLQGKDVGHIADVLAAAANKSAADIKGLGDGLKQAGLVAAQTGLSLEETTGALAAFADRALVGSDAGTSLKSMLQRLTPQSDEAAAKMRELGISAYDAQGNFIGMEGMAGNLRAGLANLTDQQRLSALGTIFGSDAVRAASVIYDLGADGVAKYNKMVHDQGAATRMAAIQMDNLAGDLEALKGSLETALIKGGSKATGALRTLVQVATGAVNVFGSLPGPVQSAAVAVMAITAAITLAGGAAMLAIPKVQAFRASLEAMGPRGMAANSALGAVGTAMGRLVPVMAVAAVGLTVWSAHKAKAKAATDEFTRAIEADSGALGENARALAAQQLQQKGATAAAREMGIPLSTLTDAALGNKAAIDQVSAATKAYLAEGGKLGNVIVLGQAVDGVTVAAKKGAAAQKDIAAATKDSTVAAGGLSAAATALAAAQQKEREATQAAAKAIRDKSDAMKAAFDPIFAMQDAIGKQTGAQKALTTAIGEHGRKSKEAAAAQQDVLRATVDVDAAVRGLRASLTDGSSSLAKVNERLNAYAKAGLITTAQAAAFKAQLAGAVTQSGALATSLGILNTKRVMVKVDTSQLRAARDIVRDLQGKINFFGGGSGAYNEAAGSARPRSARSMMRGGAPGTAGLDLAGAQARALATPVDEARAADTAAAKALAAAKAAAVGPAAAAKSTAAALTSVQAKATAAHAALTKLLTSTSASTTAARDHARALAAQAASAAYSASRMPTHTDAQRAAQKAAQAHAAALSYQAAQASRAATGIAQHNAIAVKAAREQTAAADKAYTAAKAKANAAAASASEANKAVTEAAAAAAQAHAALADAVYSGMVADATSAMGVFKAQVSGLVEQANALKGSFSSAALAGTSLGDLFKAGTEGAGVQGVESVINSMQARITATKSLATDLASLQAAGLGGDLLKQISDAGLQTGSQIAQSILAAGPDAIATLNELSAQLATTASTALDPVASALYGAGANAAFQTAEGIRSQFPELQAALDEMSAMITSTFPTAAGGTGGAIPAPSAGAGGNVTIIVQPAPTILTVDGQQLARTVTPAIRDETARLARTGS